VSSPRDSRAVALACAVTSGSLLAGALYVQYVENLPPCPLCIYQRYAHLAALGLALLALVLAGRRRSAALAAAGLAYVAGAAVAVFHVGVENRWWAGLEECVGNAGAATVEELKAQLLATTPARCDQVLWSLLGISMAGYNAMISAGLALLGLTAAAAGVTRARS
jgi:disulfide bond formation protein DsbB